MTATIIIAVLSGLLGTIAFWSGIARRRRPKVPDLVRDPKVSDVEVLLDNRMVCEAEQLRGFLGDPPRRGKQLKVSQIDYVRGRVTRVVLATHPGWNCNCHACQEKRGRDGLATQY